MHSYIVNIGKMFGGSINVRIDADSKSDALEKAMKICDSNTGNYNPEKIKIKRATQKKKKMFDV